MASASATTPPASWAEAEAWLIGCTELSWEERGALSSILLHKSVEERLAYFNGPDIFILYKLRELLRLSRAQQGSAGAARGGPAGPSGGVPILRNRKLARLLRPVDKLPSHGDVFNFLTQPDTARRLPVSRDVFQKAESCGTESYVYVPDDGFGALFEEMLLFMPENSDEDKTTWMMGLYLGYPLMQLSLAAAEQAPFEAQLEFSYRVNKAEKKDSAATVLGTLMRPDFVGTAEVATLIVGEDKGAAGMMEARDQLHKYVKPGLSAMGYGSVPYIFTYAAAGSRVQLGVLLPSGEVVWRRRHFDLQQFHARVMFLTAVVNMYCLMLQMANQLPPLRFRREVMVPMERDKRTITYTFDKVIKTVRQFTTWTAEHSPGTTLSVLKAAYHCANSCPALVSALEAPKVSRRVYAVHLVKHGPPAAPQTPEHVQGLARALCSAAAALHAAGLVHRDFRMANVVLRKNVEGDYVVLDLECAGRIGCKWGAEPLLGWDTETLNQSGKYDALSDMRQIGKLLDGLEVWESGTQSTSKPESATAMFGALLAKQLTAEAALQHPWLQAH